MTTQKRLNAIENQVANNKVPDIGSLVLEHGPMLAGILGRIDALWWPARHSKTSKAIHQSQKQFRALNGILWRSNAKNENSKHKSDERLRSKLKKLGLIEITKSQPGVFIKLTRSAESAVRQAAGLQFIPSGIAGDFEKAVRGMLNDNGFVSEDRLFDANPADRPKVSDWYESEELIISMLIDGSLKSHTSTSREIFYQLGDCPMVGLDLIGGIEYSRDIRHAYLDSWELSLDERHRSQAMDDTEVFLPLPASF